VRIGDLRVAFFTDKRNRDQRIPKPSGRPAAAAAIANEVRTMDERRPPGVEESYELEMRLIGPDGG
jgi:hypothetical protein